MKIGGLEIKYNALPAPLASLTDLVFRRLLDEIGYTGYMVTEMISAEGLRRRQEKTLFMLRPGDFKTPQFVQLFGSGPLPFIDAVKLIENETQFSGIDINMGCPANKVVRKGGGAALLKEPKQVAAIVREVKRCTSLPVTVKIRLGWRDENVLEIARILKDEGVDGVAVHFRTREDGYTGNAKWDRAFGVGEILKGVPFIGNGDIKTAAEALDRMNHFLVDAVMIGRGSVADPLIFARIAGAVPPEGIADENNPLSMKSVYRRLLELIEEHYEPKLRLPRLKAYARFLFSNRRYSKVIRQQIYTAATFEEAADYFQTVMLDEYLNPQPTEPTN